MHHRSQAIFFSLMKICIFDHFRHSHKFPFKANKSDSFNITKVNTREILEAYYSRLILIISS